MVERALICPPHSQIGPITPEQRQQIIRSSVMFGVYEKTVDRESAYERLKGKAQQSPAARQRIRLSLSQTNPGMKICHRSVFPRSLGGGGRRGDTVVDAMMKSAARSIGSSVGRQIIRGVLGSILGGSSRR